MRSTKRSSRQVLRVTLVAVCFSVLASLAAIAADDSGRCADSGTLSLCTDVTFPGEGKSCVLTLLDSGVPVSGARVTATFRPNSEVATTKDLGITSTSGQLSWTPDEAGIATLTAEAEGLDPVDLTVSVKFKRPSALGIAILLLAGMILFGGNGYSFAKTFGRK
jgi:hypothetical protein